MIDILVEGPSVKAAPVDVAPVDATPVDAASSIGVVLTSTFAVLQYPS